jgi:hypothetical protein
MYHVRNIFNFTKRCRFPHACWVHLQALLLLALKASYSYLSRGNFHFFYHHHIINIFGFHLQRNTSYTGYFTVISKVIRFTIYAGKARKYEVHSPCWRIQVMDILFMQPSPASLYFASLNANILLSILLPDILNSYSSVTRYLNPTSHTKKVKLHS